MWNLSSTPDVGSSEDDLVRALTRANGTLIYDLSPTEMAAIVAVYELYDTVLGRPHLDLLAPALSERCHGAIRNAYGQVQRNGRLKGLRERLMVNVDECPLCGFGEVTQLDHYLPRSKYGTLAVYARNLIPTCGPCNNTKRAHVSDLESERFIHAYFDILPEEQLFVADVTMEANALSVNYDIDSLTIDPDLAARLKFQLSKLNLNDRYAKQLNKFLFTQRTGMLDIFGPSGDTAALRDYLRRSAGSLEVCFGLNDWRATLMRGLERCNAFCSGGIREYYAVGLRSTPDGGADQAPAQRTSSTLVHAG